MVEKYRTVAGKGETLTIVKKSKFIANVSPVETREEATEFLEKIRKEHHNATHNCYAYRVGLSQVIVKYSDDGEPGGSAGLPILNVLEGEDIKNVVVVVTRYFGGTLLGVGGLVRAYGGSAKEGIVEAGIIEKALYSYFSVNMDYSLEGKAQYEIIDKGFYIYDTVYAEDVNLIVLAEKDKAENLIGLIEEITNANAKVEHIKDVYGAKQNNKIILD